MLLSIDTWWSSMELLEKIYWAFALPFSAVFIIQMIITLIGADGENIDSTGDADFEVDSDAGIGFQFITLKNFIAFFTIFGWTGIACLDGGLSAGITISLSIVGGILMMLLMATLFYLMGKLVESGTMKMDTAIGKTATVYLRIPAKRSGTGKIQVNMQGIRTLDAMTSNPEEIKSGSLVKIISVEADDILMVELLNS